MYDHKSVEPKWQKFWEDNKLFKADDTSDKPKHYILDMFPYPSGSGLHVGHPEGYTATDIIARYMRMKGYNILHPMGWDAFGLPAENYAIKTKVHPKETTNKSIETFRAQIKSLGFSYDWERDLATCNPDYYKWTQWFFLLLYNNGLAYKKEAPVNWCEDCKTVLANEQVIDGKCERCKNTVIQKKLAQWFFKITDFIEDRGKTSGLINGLDKIDWPHGTAVAQRNWIGRSEGVNYLKQKVKDMDLEFEMYDSIPQTYMAQTFTVIAPEHPYVEKLVAGTEHEKPVMEFVERIKEKKAAGKFDIETDMEGVFTGRYNENPFGTGDLPIWVASFVVADYGSGVINCSAHDERDFAFAKKYDIPLRPVMFPPDEEEAEKVKNLEYCYFKDPKGIIQEPEEFKGMTWSEAREPVIDHLEKNGIAERAVNYKIRDWLVSRQRYWGAPIPIIHCESCGEVPVPEEQLPVELPDDVDFLPTGESPLKFSESFHQVACPKCGSDDAKREVDTMDTFVCSSWYFFRFCDAHNEKEFASKDLMKKWMPVDLYVGGAEHTVLHLLYARFFTKALHEQGYIDFDEPFMKLRHQGMILGEDGEKMSKSRGNVINPDEVVEKYGADTLRMYEMFMGPFEQMKPWSTSGIQGIYRFVQKVWRIFTEKEVSNDTPTGDLEKLMHKSIKKVTQDIEGFDFNTAISQLMVFSNELQKMDVVPAEAKRIFVLLLSPFAPHLGEELWEMSGNKESIILEDWPEYDESLTVDDEVEIVVQVNGKVRGKFNASPDISEADALKQAKELPNLQSYLEGEIVKEIFVPGKIVNLVVKAS